MIISPNDSKTYQSLTLDNGLRVILIHDAHSEKSAASLTVNCGHFDDPFERQGMAHFLEHMVFLGTQNNPEPASFPQFISQHGGSHNAWTATEFTSYFFDINNADFDTALSHFSEFFSQPLLAEEYIEKERHAIDAEYKLKLKEDSHRIYQVHRETINPLHPFSKFSVGNNETLEDRDGISIRQELVDFHDTYYIASNMSLVLLCPLELSVQAKLVQQLFGPLPKLTGPERILTMPIYLPDHQAVEITIKPHKHTQKLIVGFFLPANPLYYQNKTLGYIGHLIGFEGEGSLLSLIKGKGWCNHLSAGRGINGSNFKDFNISFDLTESGLAHTDEIITLLFEYIELVKNGKDNDTLYRDKQSLLQLAFDYQEKTKPINQVNHLSANIFYYQPEHYLYGDYLMQGFDQAEFDKLCAQLNPTNMRLVYINPDVTTDKQANWYHTPYSINPINPEKLNRWGTLKAARPPLTLPTKNPYLQNEVKLQPREDGDEQHVPQVIHQVDGYNFWFKQDEYFNVPKGHCYIAIDCPTSIASIESIAITRLFTELFLDAVVEAHYSAELAGLSYHVYVHQGGITVHTSGISTNQHILIGQLLHSLHQQTFTERRFNEIKNQLSIHWVNSSKSKPVSQLFAILTSTLQPNNPTMAQMAAAIEQVSFEQFLAVRKALFTRIHVDAFCYGNWTKTQATDLAQSIGQALFDNAQPHDEVIRPILSLQNHHDLALEKTLKQYDNAIVMYYQADCKTPRTIALFMLLNHIMAPEFFHHLRTEKQLGYLVGTGYVPLNRYPGLALYIQSPNNSSNSLHHEITAFCQNFSTELAAINPEQWHKMQHGLITQVIEKDSNLRVTSQRFWMGIGNKDPLFDERDQVASQISQLTPADLHQFAQKILIDNSDGKLTVKTEHRHYIQQDEENEQEGEENKGNDTDRSSFKLKTVTVEQLNAQLKAFEPD